MVMVMVVVMMVPTLGLLLRIGITGILLMLLLLLLCLLLFLLLRRSWVLISRRTNDLQAAPWIMRVPYANGFVPSSRDDFLFVELHTVHRVRMAMQVDSGGFAILPPLLQRLAHAVHFLPILVR